MKKDRNGEGIVKYKTTECIYLTCFFETKNPSKSLTHWDLLLNETKIVTPKVLFSNQLLERFKKIYELRYYIPIKQRSNHSRIK